MSRIKTKSEWKSYGIICDDFDKLYDYHMSINNCQLCNVEFNEENNGQKRCLDHDHKTGLYRQTICRRCNIQFDRKRQKLKSTNKSGHMWILNHKVKNKSGNYSFTWKYQRKLTTEYKYKCFKDKIKCIALSFIMLLKEPF